MGTLMDVTEAMRRALALAAKGPANDVNPQVGCVILTPEGNVLAQGWHRGSGSPHAEIDALSKLSKKQTVGATAIVTLEPCNHEGKTGPCSKALIDAGIAHVVYGIDDPVPAFSGGAARLKNAGVRVTPGVLHDDVQKLLEVWMKITRLGRPLVTAKWATSLDGRAAAADGSSKWITGTGARLYAHEQRTTFDAIITGMGTVVADDPALTARHPDGSLYEKQPVPIVIGHGEVPAHAQVLSHPHGLLKYTGDNLHDILCDLRHKGMRRVLLEAGPRLTTSFVRENLVDQFLIFLGPILLGGDQTILGDIGVKTLAGGKPLALTSLHRVDDDIVIVAEPQERRQ